MTRRPKLSLSSGNPIDKKEPPGFEAAIKLENPQTTPRTTRAPSAIPSSHEDIRAHDPAIEATKTVPETKARPAGKQVAKVILVIIAAVLSLYLLRRRLL